MTSLKIGGPSSTELERKHFEFDGVLTGRLASALFDFFHTLHDVISGVSGEELLLEGSKEFIKGGGKDGCRYSNTMSWHHR